MADIIVHLKAVNIDWVRASVVKTLKCPFDDVHIELDLMSLHHGVFYAWLHLWRHKMFDIIGLYFLAG